MNAMKLAVPLFVALAYGPSPGLAAPILGSDLATYAVQGASGVTCVPTCFIGGNVGSDPTAPAPPATNYSFSFGTFQPGNQGAAQGDLTAAILAVNAFGLTATIADGNLDAYQTSQGGAISPGTYDVGAATTNLVGTLVLDGGGSNTAVWAFRFSSTLITSEGSDVTVIDVGDGAGVGLYWTVGSAATLDGDTFAGNVLANALISSNGGLTIACGRLASADANVTLIADSISIGCGTEGTIGFGSGGFDQAGGSNGQVPEPATLLLFGSGLAGLLAFRRRFFPVA